MNRKILLLSLIVVGLILSSSLIHVSAQDFEADPTATNIDSAESLHIEISSNKSVAFTIDDIKAMPKTIVNAELFCFGRPITGGYWGGVQLGFLLEKVELEEQPASLRFYASDGYMVHISNSYVAREDVIIAYELNGETLAEKLRLVLPGDNGQSWISMITVISIDYITYVSPTTQAPYIALDPLQNVQWPSPTLEPPQPSPTSEPRSQETTQPTITQPTITQPTIQPPTNQSVQQQNSSNSSSQVEYSYFVMPGIVIASTLSIGYLIFKRKRQQI